MRIIISIFMIIASIAGFAVFIVPHYNAIAALRLQKTDYETILTNARKLEEQQASLVNRYNSFDQAKLGQLAKMLPQNPENVKLIIELNAVARQYGMTLQNVKIEDTAADTSSRTTQQTANDMGTLNINFSVAGPYTSFTQFMKTVERSLRVIEVKKVSFAVADPKSQNYQYTLSIKTFWLK